MTQPPTPPRRPTFVGTDGRDPRQPFGQAVPAALPPGVEVGDGQVPVGSPWDGGSDQPRPPRNRLGWVVIIAVMLVVALAAWAANRWLPDPATPSTTPTATAQPSGSATPSATPGKVSTGLKDSVPFTNANDQSSGTFTITSHQWTSQGLELHVKVQLDQGQQKLVFFCLDNSTTHDYNPDPSTTDPLDGRTITAGETLEGVVVFDKPQGDTTVFLAGSDGRQVAALVVAG